VPGNDNCLVIQQDIRSLVRRLYLSNVLEYGQEFQWVTTCSRCRRNEPTACQGATIVVPENAPMLFLPCKLRDGNLVQADVAVQTKWNGSNLAEHIALLRLWHVPDSGSRRVVSRAHVDLANEGQHGPWAHLQFGGETVDDSESWNLPPFAGQPRWPAPLVDLILASELILYSFWPDVWETLFQEVEINRIVKRSENAYLREFFEEWSRYQRASHSSPNPRRTFLYSVCNTRTGPPWRRRGEKGVENT